jgi:hypothetical protein
MSTVGEYVLLNCQQISVNSKTLSEEKHLITHSAAVSSSPLPQAHFTGEGLEN